MSGESSKKHASTGSKRGESPKRSSGRSRSKDNKRATVDIPKKPEDLSQRAEVKEHDILWAQKEEQEKHPAVKEYLKTLKRLARSEENTVVRRHLVNKNGGPNAIPIPLQLSKRDRPLAESLSGESEAARNLDMEAGDSSDTENFFGKMSVGRVDSSSNGSKAPDLAKDLARAQHEKKNEEQKEADTTPRVKRSTSNLTQALVEDKIAKGNLPFSERLKKEKAEKAEKRRRNRATGEHRSRRHAGSSHSSDAE
jgi:hypothetical protein